MGLFRQRRMAARGEKPRFQPARGVFDGFEWVCLSLFRHREAHGAAVGFPRGRPPVETKDRGYLGATFSNEPLRSLYVADVSPAIGEDPAHLVIGDRVASINGQPVSRLHAALVIGVVVVLGGVRHLRVLCLFGSEFGPELRLSLVCSRDAQRARFVMIGESARCASRLHEKGEIGQKTRPTDLAIDSRRMHTAKRAVSSVDPS